MLDFYLFLFIIFFKMIFYYLFKMESDFRVKLFKIKNILIIKLI